MSKTNPIDGVRIIPLGGVGEFGANATIIQSEDTTILIDFGLMFPPDGRQPGVDFYINDPLLIKEQFPKLEAILVTHAHEDHIGGLAYLCRHFDLPIYSLGYTLKIIAKAFGYHRNLTADLREVALNETVTVGDLKAEFIGVTHSIVGACAIAVDTPQGRIIHSGDFKVDPLPQDNHPFQSDRLRALGEEGVDLLIMDSTNATKPGFCPSDFQITPCLEELVRSASGRVFLTTFSSHMPRIKKLLQIARDSERKLVFVGKSFQKHFNAGLEEGYLPYTPNAFATVEQARDLPEGETLYVVAGSQGEPGSTLSRIRKGMVKNLAFGAGDLMIFSSKNIPGNERQVMLLASDLERVGVTVVTQGHWNVHTSGHGYQEDLSYMLALTKPKTVAPIHGEFHQLSAHFKWLNHMTADHQNVMLIEDGDVLVLKQGEVRNLHKIETRMIPIDGNQNCALTPKTLSQRKDMMYSGLVLVSVTVAGEGPLGQFEVSTNGLAEEEEGHLADALVNRLKPTPLNPGQPLQQWGETVHRSAKKALKKLMFGKPLIKVIVNGTIVR